MPHFPRRTEEAPSHDNGVDQSRLVRIKNRRRRYLDLHPEYFKEPHHELSDPLLYERLVRRFQSTAEREREGREQGYSRILEANLIRSEARLEALEHPDPDYPLIYTRTQDGSIVAEEQDAEDRVLNQEDGWKAWVELLRVRFVRGDDADFDYATVDDSDEYDDLAEEGRGRLEAYLDGEEEEFVGRGPPTGQTGIQDF